MSLYPTRRAALSARAGSFSSASNRRPDVPCPTPIRNPAMQIAGMPVGVDGNLRRILDYLGKHEPAENTIVISTGDNGFFLGEYGMFDKRLMYVPSIRMPMQIRYPAAILPGIDRERTVLNNGVAHTIVDNCGGLLPPCTRTHGRSWRPLFDGAAATSWRAGWLYENFEYAGPHCVPKARGVRTAERKLIPDIQQPQPYEMFHLATGPGETRNLAGNPRHLSPLETWTTRLHQLRCETADEFGKDGTAPGPCTNRMAARGRGSR